MDIVHHKVWTIGQNVETWYMETDQETLNHTQEYDSFVFVENVYMWERDGRKEGRNENP